MPTPIEQLQQPGFSDNEIGDWAKTQRPYYDPYRYR
jgi:hypothetical protein